MTRKRLYPFFLIISAFLLICCAAKDKSLNDVKTDYKAYYYPIGELSTPKVYHFSADDEKNGDLFWVLSTVTENGKTYLLTDSYATDSSGNLNHIEVIKEEINDQGAFVKEYVETQRNQSGQTFKSTAIMESEEAFLWNLKADKEITWKFKNESKVYPGFNVETYRKRKYTGEMTTITFNDKETPAIKFDDNFRVSYIRTTNNQRDDYDFTQTSYYAKGIGLYQYTRVYDEGQITVTLTEILSLDEWEKIKTASDNG